MTGQRNDDGIQWTKAMSKFGVPFEYGVLNTAVARKREEKSQAHVADSGVWYPVNWQVTDSNAWVEVGHHLAADTLVWRYKAFSSPWLGFTFRFEFTNTGGWNFTFRDATGDEYDVSTVFNGDHFFRYNSEQPNIVAVKHD